MTADPSEPGHSTKALGRLSPVRMRLVRLFLRLAPTERNRLFILTVVIGGVCGLAAVAFHSAIRLASRLLIENSLAAPGRTWIAWALVTPTVGALFAGLTLAYVLPSGRGSGIPQVKFVYAVKSGRLRLRDAVGKFLVATVQLGSGSSLGREGPTVFICASLASSLGRLFAISPNNLRRLIPVGAAAGIAAAFNAPIAAVTFTIEEIVGDLDQTVLSGVVVAAAVAAAVEHSILGEHPVFSVPSSYRLEHPSSLLIYAALGVGAAILSRVFYSLLLALRSRARALGPVQRAILPAVGGLFTGALGVLLILSIQAGGVLGDGYATLSAALVGQVPLQVMAALVLAKLLATVACYSSGGAGGIFAPVLFIGAMLGGVFGHLDRFILSHPDGDLGAFALVGMGAFFAAVIRAPITSVLIIFEMTRGYGLVLPLMIANTVAYGFARTFKPVAIYEALLEQDGLHLPQTQRAAAALTSFRVSDSMTTVLVTLSTGDTVERGLERVRSSAFSIYPVIDDKGVLKGLVSEARLRRRIAEGQGNSTLDIEARAERYLHQDLPLVDAVAVMRDLGVRQMAVVEGDQGHLVGVLAMSDVMRAYSQAAQGIVADEGNATAPGRRSAVSWKRRDTSLTFQHPPIDPGDPPKK